jgi:peptide/nickel transport system ATP-binding protein
MLLEAIGLKKNYRMGVFKGHTREVIRGVNLGLRCGETIGIMGDSGSGKSTLCLLLAGLIGPSAGQILFDEIDIRSRHGRVKKNARRRLQILFQHPENAFDPLWKLQRSMAEPFVSNGLPFRRRWVEHQLKQLGLDAGILERRPAQLSGGELQRLSIARVLSLEPDVILLDEPTSMLDMLTQARIIKILKDIQKDTGVSFIFVSHDAHLVRLFSDRVFLLRGGTLRSLN